MRYNQFGRTGLFVSEICLGTMTFGGTGDLWSRIGALQQGAVDGIVRTALDAGVDFIDTADVYSFGQSEQLLGQALRNLGIRRSNVVIATKVFGQMGAGPNERGASRGAYHGQRGRKPRAAADRPYRPVSDPRHRRRHPDRGNPARARRPRAAGKGALCRRLQLAGLADHEGARHFRARRPRPFRQPAGLLHHRRPRHRARDRAAADRGTGGADGVESRSPAACCRASSGRGRTGRKARGGRASTSRRWTGIAPGPASPPCARLPQRTAFRWRGWRWPGCSPGRT